MSPFGENPLDSMLSQQLQITSTLFHGASYWTVMLWCSCISPLVHRKHSDLNGSDRNQNTPKPVEKSK